MSSEEQLETQFIGPGQILKSARLSANLSVKDIAQKIHLKSIMIEDLEADKYDHNISLTFIKGYLKLYARQVLVTEAEIMKAFEGINLQKKEPAKLQSFSRRVANQENDDKLMLVTYFILAAVFALVVVWWFQQGESDNSVGLPALSETTSTQEILDGSVNQSLAGIVSTTQVNNSEPPQEIVLDDVAPRTLSQELETEALDNLTDLAAQETASEAYATSEISEQALLDNTQSQLAEIIELVFEFSADCWMNLSDATGEDIAYGVKASGRVMSVSGIPPFVVTLGAPQAVQITYAGDVVDMSVFKPGNTAKFTLPLVD